MGNAWDMFWLSIAKMFGLFTKSVNSLDNLASAGERMSFVTLQKVIKETDAELQQLDHELQAKLAALPAPKA